MAERQDLRNFFELISHVDFDRTGWRATEELAWKLDREGKVLPLADLIIAVCALRVDAEILTHDAHFRFIPNLHHAKW